MMLAQFLDLARVAFIQTLIERIGQEGAPVTGTVLHLASGMRRGAASTIAEKGIETSSVRSSPLSRVVHNWVSVPPFSEAENKVLPVQGSGVTFTALLRQSKANAAAHWVIELLESAACIKRLPGHRVERIADQFPGARDQVNREDLLRTITEKLQAWRTTGAPGAL